MKKAITIILAFSLLILCIVCYTNCCFNTAAWFDTSAPENTKLSEPVLIKFPYDPDRIQYFDWPDTKEANRILTVWWEKSGKHQGKVISACADIVPDEYYKFYFSDKVVIGFSFDGKRIYYNGKSSRETDEYDMALYQYLYVITQTKQPISFEQGVEKVKYYQDLFKRYHIILPEFVLTDSP